MTVKDYVNSEDPLSDDSIDYLVRYQEEDVHVDYKETIPQEDWRNEKSWLELTKDFMAFANTKGGYLVFGIDDLSFDVKGLNDEVRDNLSETKKILDKINRYVEPDFTDVRSKEFDDNGQSIVAVYIPPSRGKTHIVTKEGSFLYPSGDKEVVLSPGDIYVRRSATNHIISPEGLDMIINKRIEYYKEKLFDRIFRISEISPTRLIKVEEEPDEADSYRLSSDPDATPVAGMSYTTKPSSFEEEIASNMALARRDPNHNPSEKRLWAIYSNRMSLTLTDEMAEWLFQTYLLNSLPSLYWCARIDPHMIKEIIRESIHDAESLSSKSNIIKVSMCFGDGFYRSTIGEFSEREQEHLDYKKDNFESHKLENCFNQYLIEGIKAKNDFSSMGDFEDILTEKLNKLTSYLSQQKDRESEDKAYAIDYYLYHHFMSEKSIDA